MYTEKTSIALSKLLRAASQVLNPYEKMTILFNVWNVSEVLFVQRWIKKLPPDTNQQTMVALLEHVYWVWRYVSEVSIRRPSPVDDRIVAKYDDGFPRIERTSCLIRSLFPLKAVAVRSQTV